VNLYQYVGNNPASYTDPFGLMLGCPPDCDVLDFGQLRHIIDRHVSGSAGSQFADMDPKALRHVIRSTVTGGEHVGTQMIAGEARHVFERNFKSSVGTQGQRIVRVVIGEGQRLVTAFPVKNPLAGLATGTGSSTLGRAAKGSVGGIVGAFLGVMLTPSALNASPCDDNPSACDP
jgi:hypothetical protein